MVTPRKRDISLRGKIIYSVYLRNHTPEGTFAALEGDLDRIKALGTDIIWLLPIHPIGQLNKKGGLGCPYSISDYRGINPAYGTEDDLKHLVGEIHARGMLCIIDVVYNHTSHDSVLFREHPNTSTARRTAASAIATAIGPTCSISIIPTGISGITRSKRW